MYCAELLGSRKEGHFYVEARSERVVQVRTSTVNASAIENRPFVSALLLLFCSLLCSKVCQDVAAYLFGKLAPMN